MEREKMFVNETDRILMDFVGSDRGVLLFDRDTQVNKRGKQHRHIERKTGRDRQVARQADRETDRQGERDKQITRETGIYGDRQVERQAGSETGRYTRQVERHTRMDTGRETYRKRGRQVD